MTINGINDLANCFGTTVDRLEHDLYKYTDCGAWIIWDDESVTIGSIVEGSDAEFDRRFVYPFESQEVSDWMDELEDLTDEAWHEANDECDE